MKGITCQKHQSVIGGVCNESSCQNKTQLLCMNCISDPSNCIRTQKHTFIPVMEYVDQFFSKDYYNLKNDTNTSSSINNVEKFCKEANGIVENFILQKEQIGSEIVEMYQGFINHINSLFVAFNEFYMVFIEEKEDNLKKSLANLYRILRYEELGGMDIEALKYNMGQMNFNALNSTILNMKEVLSDLKEEAHKPDEEIVKQIAQLNNEKIIQFFRDECNAMTAEADVKFNLYKSKIRDSLFKEEVFEIKNISSLKTIYDGQIDFSANSNFLTKKFTLFEHSNGNTFFAYPTSQNTIKIEYFDKFINEELKAVTPPTKKNIMQAMQLNSRDKYLYFTLSAHGGRINDLIYYRKEQSDYLISSSDDCSIKIWDITKLNLYLNNVNEYYRNNCVKTLVGHQGKVIAMVVFYDPLSCTNLIVSIGYMDKIKVFNLITGQFVRDIADANGSRGSHDNLLVVTHLRKKNYMITGNSTSKLVKLWDFDKGQLVRAINYGQNKRIVELYYEEERERLFVLDDSGSCGYVNLQKEDVAKIDDGKMEDCGSERCGLAKWDSDVMMVYCKNGTVCQYDMTSGKIVDRVKIAGSFISYAMGFNHLTRKKVFMTHSGDQHFKVFN